MVALSDIHVYFHTELWDERLGRYYNEWKIAEFLSGDIITVSFRNTTFIEDRDEISAKSLYAQIDDDSRVAFITEIRTDRIP